LTTNLVVGADTNFTTMVITPSVEAIVKSRACKNGDLTNLILDGAVMTGVDFTGARFDNASLIRSNLSGCTLTSASLTNSTLKGIILDQAILDNADMTQSTLGPPSWGAPARARGLILTQCHAAGAVLGGSAVLDATDAILSGGDFTDANLEKPNLTGGKAAGAIFVRANLTGALLDNADLTNIIAVGAILKRASMHNVRGPNAVLASADLSNSDLAQAQFGAKTFLYVIPVSLAADLDGSAYPTTKVIDAFAQRGTTLDPQSPIVVVTKGARWEIDDHRGPYVLIHAAGDIDVFLASPDIMPAILHDAICLDTKASGAGLSGADLRRVKWYGANATLDHADLENAVMSDSLLTGTDFTQAFLSGADLSRSVLVQAKFTGCSIGPVKGAAAFSLEDAQIQGCDFTEANLRGALLIGAGVATRDGVPLFTLPSSDAKYLTPNAIAGLASTFADAGYPLGSDPTVSTVDVWTIDNSADPITSDPRSYVVRRIAGRLRVYDGNTSRYYFALPNSALRWLANPTASQELIAMFVSAGYGLVAAAIIATDQYWALKTSSDAILNGAFGYSTFSIFLRDDSLSVFGSTLLLLRDWSQFPSGLAFSATSKLESALNQTCLGPSGAPMAWLASGRLAWGDFVTVAGLERRRPTGDTTLL
jgi:uncharacterized protein YjbI with pentapeptide repeats